MKYQEKNSLSINGLGFLEQFIVGHNGFIAGGCFKNIFLNERIKDIDIFFKSEHDFNKAVIYYNEHGGDLDVTRKEDIEYEFVYRNDKCICFRHLKTSIKLEIICTIFGTPEDILDAFDFTIVKYALYVKESYDIDDDPFGNHPHFENICIYHPDFFEHLIQRKIVIDDAIPFPVSTFERILKYQSYGFKLCNETKKKIVKAINDKENINDEEFSSALYGAASGGWD